MDNPSTGLAAIEEAVTFTNTQVLDPTAGLTEGKKIASLDVGAGTIADQAAAMMVEDMRAFLQSMEMILIPVASAAYGEVLAGDSSGEKTLKQVANMMNALPAYAFDIIQAAGGTQPADDIKWPST